MKVTFVNNSMVPYRHYLFKYLFRKYHHELSSSKVLYLAKKESIREWSESYSTDDYPYLYLKKITQYRNKKSTTSDYIINYSYLKHIKNSDILFTLGYSYYTYMIMCIYAKLKGIKTICFCETNDIDKERPSWKKKAKKILLDFLYDHFAVPGINAKKYLLNLGISHDKISVIGNSAPFSKEQYSSDENIQKDNNIIKFLYVGRFSEEKNLMFALSSLEEIQYKDKEISITLIGDGPLKSDISNLAKNSHHKYVISPFTERENLPDIYKLHDIFILPSASEPWGLVINEAIQFGLAILASCNVGAAPELINNNGEIFNVNSKADLIDKTHKVISNLSNYKKNSILLSTQYSLQSNAEKIIECLSMLKEK